MYIGISALKLTVVTTAQELVHLNVFSSIDFEQRKVIPTNRITLYSLISSYMQEILDLDIHAKAVCICLNGGISTILIKEKDLGPVTFQ